MRRFGGCPVIAALFATLGLLGLVASDASGFSSARDQLYTFTYSGQLLTDARGNAQAAITNQLYYTVGQLNGWNAVGRLDTVKLKDVKQEAVPGSTTRVKVSYTAVLEVAWPTLGRSPQTFRFRLPLDMSSGGAEAFLAKYNKLACLDWVAHNVTTGIHWYYYRPDQNGCAMNAADLMEAQPTVERSPQNSNGRYPEYQEIWKAEPAVDADGKPTTVRAFRAVIVYGRDQEGSGESFSDFGFNAFIGMNYLLRGALSGGAIYQGPKLTIRRGDAPQGAAPDLKYPDQEYSGSFADGRRIQINTLLIDNPQAYNPKFDERYAALSTAADLIVYNGHAALGGNVRAMTKKGKWQAKKYQIVYMDGCDSFAYVDGYLAAARAKLNPDDPTGTRYLDMITNGLPANPTWFTVAMAALINNLIDINRPRTWEQILREFERNHIAVVTGDEDNTFDPVQTPLKVDETGDLTEGSGDGGGGCALASARTTMVAGAGARGGSSLLAALLGLTLLVGRGVRRARRRGGERRSTGCGLIRVADGLVAGPRQSRASARFARRARQARKGLCGRR